MNDSQLYAWFAPLRQNSHRTAMIAADAADNRAIQIACLTAILEGTMAGAIEILGAGAAYNLIQPLADRVLDL